MLRAGRLPPGGLFTQARASVRDTLSTAAPTHHTPGLRQDPVAHQPEQLTPWVLRHHCWAGLTPLGTRSTSAWAPWGSSGLSSSALGDDTANPSPLSSSTCIFRAHTMCQAALGAQGGMNRHESPSPDGVSVALAAALGDTPRVTLTWLCLLRPDSSLSP